jgi:hypothetical protein
LSIDSFWYFDYGTTKHVNNNDLSISFLKRFHKNTIIIAWFKLVKLRVYVNLANETNIDITFFDVITNERWRKAMKE